MNASSEYAAIYIMAFSMFILAAAETPAVDANSGFFWQATVEILLPTVVLVLILALLRNRIIKKLVGDKGLHSLVSSLDTLLAAVAAWIVAAWQIYNPQSWVPTANRPVHALAVVVGVVALIFAIKFLTNRAASAEREEIKELNRDKKTLLEHRNWLLSTIGTIDQILADKAARLNEFLKQEGPLSATGVFSVDSVHAQINVIVHSIHGFFQDEILQSETLRLAVFIRNDADPNSLIRAFSWDGKADECFTGQSDAYLKLFRPEGAVSFVVKSFLSPGGISIVPDTSHAASGFEFLRVDQRDRIRSALAYRFTVPSNGEDDIWLIYMDCNRTGFFDVAKKAAYETFFEQATKRIAFEASYLQLLERIQY